MKSIINFLLFITIFGVLNCENDGPNAIHYILQDSAGQLKLNITNSFIQIESHGHSGKSVFKVSKEFNSKEEHDDIAQQLNSLNGDVRCNLYDSSVVCILFGNELLEMKTREIDTNTGVGKYEVTTKVSDAKDELLARFEINKNLLLFDIALRSIMNS
jgi:hypothetical protein